MKSKEMLRIPILVMFLAATLVMSVSAEVFIYPEKAVFNANARFISFFCNPEPLPAPSDGDNCSFLVTGNKMRDQWKGRGLWVDKDWQDGALKAVFTINHGNVFRNPDPEFPDIFLLHGEADVFIDGEFADTYRLFMALCESKIGDWVDFYLYLNESPGPPPPWQDPWANCYYWAGSCDGLTNGYINTIIIKE